MRARCAVLTSEPPQELELNRRVNLRILQAESKRDALFGLISSSLVRIPKRIQDMNVREFAAHFGGSVQLVLDHEKKRMQGTLTTAEASTLRKAPPPPFKAAAVKSAAKAKIREVARQGTLKKSAFGAGKEVLATPMTLRNRNVPAVPGSAVHARQTPHGTTTSTPVITVAVPVGSHDKAIVDFSKKGALENLEDDQKEAAVLELQKLQDKVSQLMERLKGPVR